MAWRGPEVPGEFPTLGYAVAEWIEAHCVVPDGEWQGTPYRLTDEMLGFVLGFYRLDPVTGRWFYARGGQIVGPQKWGKGPFGAAIVCAEACGPTVFDGWDARGEPVGRPWATPWIQITAVSLDQTDNVWRALQPMIELGAVAADVPDTGETRINLPDGGRIEPVTASARSRLGQRITFALEDETHSWSRFNGGRALADNQRRNLAGMRGRWLETTNAWDPAEGSVAEDTAREDAADVLRMMPSAGTGSIRNARDRRRMLERVYRGCWWIDVERIDAEVVGLLGRDPVQAERYFLNRVAAGSGAAIDPARWEALTLGWRPEDRRMITIGVDGARREDALAVVACDVEAGHVWPLGIWEAPLSAGDRYEHDLEAVDRVLVEAFERWQVWRVYIDPQRIEVLVNRWQGRWGTSRILEWWTNRPTPMAYAVRRFVEAVAAGEVTHDGDPVLARHVRQAQRRRTNVKDDRDTVMWTVSKSSPDSRAKIDGAVAAILAWEARGDAIAAGARPVMAGGATY